MKRWVIRLRHGDEWKGYWWAWGLLALGAGIGYALLESIILLVLMIIILLIAVLDHGFEVKNNSSWNETVRKGTGGVKMSKPVKKFKAGGISCSVWRNEVTKDDRSFEVFSVQIERRYRDQNDQWKSTNSYKVNDLPKVSMLAGKAFEYLTAASEEAELGM